MRLTRSRSLSIHSVLLLAILAVTSMTAQSPARRSLSDSQQSPETQSILWSTGHANHMMGMPEVKPKSDGQLVLTKNELRFDSAKGGHGAVPVASITAVYNGDEQVEKGGKPVRIVRMFIPYGAGSIAAAVYNGQIGLFTIEFRDNDGGYHGMVFRMPVKDASLGLSQLASLIQSPADASSQLPEASCSSEPTAKKTLTVDPIISDIKQGDPALPAEYKALVYEHLVQTLETKADLDHVYRYGSREQHCANYTVDVTIRGFKKGNNAVRATVLYLGAFIGTTQLTYHLRVTDRSGQVVIEQDLKKTIRGERESLDVTNQIAKATAKSLVKASKKSQAS